MNDVQVRLLELIGEVGQAFNKAGISYGLGSRLAWDAVKFGGFHDSTYDAVLFARLRDRRRIIKALALAGQGKRVPHIGASRNTIEYVDHETTLIDLSRVAARDFPGITVVIELVETSLLGKGCRLSCSGGIECLLPRRFTDEMQDVEFENRIYPVSRYIEAYFEKVVGNGWRELKWPLPINHVGFGVVSSTTIPFSSFLKEANRRGIYDDQLLDDWEYFKRWYSTEYARSKKQVAASNDVLGLFEERYRLWDKYRDSKQLLLERFNDGCEVAVECALEDYLSTMTRYYVRYNIAICFDVELFELAARMLEIRGIASADELHSCIPDGHEVGIASDFILK